MIGDAMVVVRLKYVLRDVDRHGKTRFYFRRVSTDRKIKLPGIPGEPEFQGAYAEALAGRLAPKASGLARVSEESLEWLCNQYFASTDFKAELSDSSQSFRRNILRKVCSKAGALPFRRLEGRHVMQWMDDRADRPEAANNLLKTLRGLFRFAVKRQFISRSPTDTLKKIKTKSDGFHTWTLDEVWSFLAAHPRGTMPCLVLYLALFTGLRRRDLVSLGQQHVDGDGYLVLRTGKTGAAVELPILPILQAVLDVTPRHGLMFVENAYGRPYTAASLGMAFRKWADRAGLKHCTLHGLRKAGATLAANNGATDRQLMAIYGWSKADMATLYTRRRDNRRLAGEGMQLIDIGSKPEQKVTNLPDRLGENAKKVSENNA
jgi:integrase